MGWELFALLGIGLAGALTSATIWSRRNTWLRGAALVAFLLMIPVITGVGFSSLGHPAPWIQTLTVLGGEYPVLGVKMVQDVAIYVWLDFGVDHPRYFALPWDNETADRLQGLIDQQQRGEGGFTLNIPYEKSWDRSPPDFQPLPQPKKVPDKLPQQQEPRRLERAA